MANGSAVPLLTRPCFSRRGNGGYALLRRPALREAFGNISSPVRGTTRRSAFFPPRAGAAASFRARCDAILPATKGPCEFLRHLETTWDDTGRYNAVRARPWIEA